MSREPRAIPPHVASTAIVLDELRLVYVPVPKAGSTAVLWALAELTGLDPDRFRKSRKSETTRALTIHDMSLWGQKRRLDRHRPSAVLRMFDSDDWLAFTLVREPVRRIWSAWVSKVLMREPRFTTAYGDESWFPPVPSSAEDVVDWFRVFVKAVSDRPETLDDRHWASQAELLGVPQLGYDFVGRLEELPSALAVVDEHLRSRGAGPLSLQTENRSLVPFTPEVLDRRAWKQCFAVTARDREAFDYEAVPIRATALDKTWRANVEASLPAIRAVVERNERIGDVTGLATRSRGF